CDRYTRPRARRRRIRGRYTDARDRSGTGGAPRLVVVTDHDRRRDALARELRARIGAEVVDISHRRRVEYSSDASNYRVLPEVVVFPRGDADVAAALELARSEGVPFTARGGGTSVAGNAVGPGI